MHHLPWTDAIEAAHRAGAGISRLESVPLADSLNLVLAQDLHAPIALPHYASSAMDGYAFAGSAPWRLIDPEPVSAHENRHARALPVSPGTASPILTGGLLPEGADAILRIEQAELKEQDGKLWLYPTGEVPAPGADMRRAGEELPQGSLVAEAGQKLTPRLVAFLAVCGFDELPVYPRPRVALAYTGNEVITSGIPGPGQVRDAYSTQFPFLVESFGAQVLSTARLHDDMAEIESWFFGRETASADLLILTGGSSTSDVDLVRQFLNKQQASFVFEAVAVRPGHPCLFACLPDGRYVLGLPGNPLAAHTSLYSYLPAFLAGYAKQPLPVRPEVRLAAPVASFKKQDLRLIPASLQDGVAQPLLDKSKSHMLSAFSRADVLLAVGPEGLEAGASVQVLPLTF